MTDVVGAKLDLVSFLRDTIWAGHDAGIVQEHIQALALACELLGGAFDAVEGGQVAFEEFDGRLGGGRKSSVDFVDCCFSFAARTSGEVDGLWVMFGELVNSFTTETYVAARDEDDCRIVRINLNS